MPITSKSSWQVTIRLVNDTDMSNMNFVATFEAWTGSQAIEIACAYLVEHGFKDFEPVSVKKVLF